MVPIVTDRATCPTGRALNLCFVDKVALGADWLSCVYLSSYQPGDLHSHSSSICHYNHGGIIMIPWILQQLESQWQGPLVPPHLPSPCGNTSLFTHGPFICQRGSSRLG